MKFKNFTYFKNIFFWKKAVKNGFRNWTLFWVIFWFLCFKKKDILSHSDTDFTFFISLPYNTQKYHRNLANVDSSKSSSEPFSNKTDLPAVKDLSSEISIQRFWNMPTAFPQIKIQKKRNLCIVPRTKGIRDCLGHSSNNSYDR